MTELYINVNNYMYTYKSQKAPEMQIICTTVQIKRVMKTNNTSTAFTIAHALMLDELIALVNILFTKYLKARIRMSICTSPKNMY